MFSTVLPPAALEDWLRDYYFSARIDISSSGVHPYRMAEVRALLGISLTDLDAIEFRDSPSRGDGELRAAIATRFGDGDPARVFVTNGSSEALFLVMAALLRPADEVVVLEPAYHSLDAIAEAIGCRVLRCPLRFSNGYRLDLEELAALLSPATRALVVNFPHNPTGASVTAEQQQALVELAADAGVYLLWDAVFAELTHDGPPLPDTSRLYERAITFNTLSKGYGLPGLRVGWCIAPQDVIGACVRVRDYTTLALSPLVELVARRAVEDRQRLLTPRLAEARHNLDLVAEWVWGNEGRVEWIRPLGGVVAFPRLLDVPDVDAFCRSLMREQRVLLVPGSCFRQPRHVRLGFGLPTAELEEGLQAVSAALTAA